MVPGLRDWRSLSWWLFPKLVSGLDAELVRLGYKPSTMVWYRGCWRRLETFFASRGVREFSLDVAMTWVDQACGGFFDKEQAGTLKATDVYLFRVAAMLDDFAVHGAVLRRYSRTVDKLSGDQADVLARFRASLQTAGCAASTVRAYGTVAGEFLAFTDTRGGLAGLDAGVIDAFVATLAGYQAKTVEHKLCAVRSLLRFAVGDGLVDAAVLEAVPAAKSTRQARIPSVWDPADVTKILQAIDRGNPCGKRDYAIILLITRLGLRGIDVKRLQFADLDWPGNRLSVVQAKTGRRVQLPLLKDVGWAIIDYIRHGRPQATARRCSCGTPPRSARSPTRITCTRSWSSTPGPRTCRWASSAATACTRCGTRWRLGCWRQGTPVEQIADILGHQSVASTGVYLKSSLRLLASAPWTRTHRRRGRRGERRASRCPTRSRPWWPRNAPSATSTTPRRGCWPGSRRSAAASSPGWTRSPRRRCRRGSPRHDGGTSSLRRCRPGRADQGAGPLADTARPAYLLPGAALPRPTRYVPHIYTDAELAALFAQTDRCHYCAEVPLRHLVMPVLFRTIYACGLRCSEARLLRVADVDIDTGVLQIRDAKGGKDRQVPVSGPLRDRLADYDARVAGQPDRRDWFFPGKAGRAADARQRLPQLPPVPLAGGHLPRRTRARPQGARSTSHDRGQQPAVLVRPGA